MAAQSCKLPDELLLLLGNHFDWEDEFDRRHTLYNLTLVSRQFNQVFMEFLYEEFEYTEEDEFYEEHVKALVDTLQRKPELAACVRKLKIANWCPEKIHDPATGMDMIKVNYEFVNQLVSLAWNVRELQIRLPLPYVPILRHKPFSQLEKIHLFAFVMYVRMRTAKQDNLRRVVHLPTFDERDKALNLSGLAPILAAPKLSELNIEAQECIGGSFPHPIKSISSSIDTIQVHTGLMDTSVVNRLVQRVTSLKTFRYSVLDFYDHVLEGVNPIFTPSTRSMSGELKRHVKTLTTLEITKCVGLSSRGAEIIESLSDFEQLRSLCIDAAMLVGRWHCKKHAAEKVGHLPATVTTWADVDKALHRHPIELADSLPSGLEDPVLGINDDMPDSFIFDILSGIVKQRARLSELHRIAFYRNTFHYCTPCQKVVGFHPPHHDNALYPHHSGIATQQMMNKERNRKLRDQVLELTANTGLKVFIGFEYIPWPQRQNLWDSAGPCVTDESSVNYPRIHEARFYRN